MLLAWKVGVAAGPDDFGQIERAVNDYFHSLPSYQPNGIITRGEARQLLSGKEFAWLGQRREEILRRVPDEGEFLVRQLRSPSGRRFAGRIGAYPRAYDRLDRLTRLSYGKQHVKTLIHGRGGAEWIKYLTTNRRGIALARSISRAKNGNNFDKPTGRIYTAQMLLAELRKRYDARSD